MKTIKEQADALVSTHHTYSSTTLTEATIHAIKSVKHTIEVLDKVKKSISDDWYKASILVAINEQDELLTELKSRL